MEGKREYAQGVAALLTYGTIAKAAEVVGVTELTLGEWAQDAEFQCLLQEARRQAMSAVIARLQRAIPAVIETLENMMVSPKSTVATKIAAARILLHYGLHTGELQEIKASLHALEEAARKQQQQRKAKGDTLWA